MSEQTLGKIEFERGADSWEKVNAHIGGSNAPALVNRSSRTDHEIAEALDQLHDVMSELLKAIRTLTDQLVSEQWDRRYGRNPNRNVGRLPWEARPSSPRGQDALDPNDG